MAIEASSSSPSAASVSPQRVVIVVGEASGDILGAGLMAELQRRFPKCEFEGVGGPLMIALGFRSLFAMDRLAVMGLIDPLKRLPELLSMRKQLGKHVINTRPDIFIGIDAPDFNLTLEHTVRKAGIVTVHYVSPSVWAWRQGRVKKIVKAVDLMLTLFPFEAKFYQQHDVSVRCVGHTLADQIPLSVNVDEAKDSLGINVNTRIVAVLPGSRSGEVKYLGKPFLRAAEICLKVLPDLLFIIPAANEQRFNQLKVLLADFPHLPVKLVLKQSHTVMAASEAVIMASGTTTLEAMLLKKPMVIAYKMAPLSFAILRCLVKSVFVGLPNLLAGRALVPELLQSEATAENIATELLTFLQNPNKVRQLYQEFEKIHLQLKKNADIAAADAICELLEGV